MLHLLETTGIDFGVPSWVFGLIALAIFLGVFFALRSFGKGRPHW